MMRKKKIDIEAFGVPKKVIIEPATSFINGGGRVRKVKDTDRGVLGHETENTSLLAIDRFEHGDFYKNDIIPYSKRIRMLEKERDDRYRKCKNHGRKIKRKCKCKK